ncbi:hypothetical protein C9940_00695 [Pseudidiomarina aestuarii]|uniref:Uncharacterized protein n=1 Tax=Pseudidiomarina aestuarii TaxID=624146 RepID=A0A2T4CZ09_9GAMM|nr:hypothetical protein C9940_00695 [Pseudidiomarina aestuarii]
MPEDAIYYKKIHHGMVCSRWFNTPWTEITTQHSSSATKFRKVHKGRNRGLAQSCNKVSSIHSAGMIHPAESMFNIWYCLAVT